MGEIRSVLLTDEILISGEDLTKQAWLTSRRRRA
jgi:hypothetical protein